MKSVASRFTISIETENGVPKTVTDSPGTGKAGNEATLHPISMSKSAKSVESNSSRHGFLNSIAVNNAKPTLSIIVELRKTESLIDITGPSLGWLPKEKKLFSRTGVMPSDIYDHVVMIVVGFSPMNAERAVEDEGLIDVKYPRKRLQGFHSVCNGPFPIVAMILFLTRSLKSVSPEFHVMWLK